MRQPPKKFNPDPFEYHHELEITIDTLTNLGVGLGRHEGWVVMVPFSLPGERVRCRIYRNHKAHSDADLIEVIEPSTQRVEPQCTLFTTCGGCQYQHFNYEAQLEWKTQQVSELMTRIGKLEIPVSPAIGSPKQYGYRSKLTPHFQKPRDENFDIGFLKNGQRQAIVDVPHCPIATDAINEALPKVREENRALWKKKKKGGTLLLRHTNEGVITDHNAQVTEHVGNKAFSFLAGDFFQNNPFILPLMIDYAIEEAQAEGIRYLVDAYCGAGIFSIAGSEYFDACMGVELSASSVKWANANASINGLKNCEYRVGKAESIFEQVTFPAEETVVLIDPPRKGCDEAFIDQLCAYNPKRLVYVSCAPDTQARDLELLTQRGYSVEKLQPFDLFPQTRHIENVATLVRL